LSRDDAKLTRLSACITLTTTHRYDLPLNDVHLAFEIFERLMDEVLLLRLSADCGGRRDGSGGSEARGGTAGAAAASAAGASGSAGAGAGAAARLIPAGCPAVNAVMIASLQIAHKYNAGSLGERDLSVGDVARALSQSARLRSGAISRKVAQTLEITAFELCGWSLPPCPALSAATLLSVLLVNMRATHRVELDSDAMFIGLPDLLLASLIHSPKMANAGALMIRVCGCCAVSVFLEGAALHPLGLFYRFLLLPPSLGCYSSRLSRSCCTFLLPLSLAPAFIEVSATLSCVD
jgi:hypothetical protein